MRRVLITGVAGAGKSTVALRLAPLIGVARHGLDDLFYGPDLGMAATFPGEIDRITAGTCWLFDSAGPPADSPAPPELRDLMWTRADTLVWLDYPRRVVLWRATRRSLRRILTRERLWHGRCETPRWWLRADRPIRRAWHTGSRRQQVTVRLGDPRWQHLGVIRLASPHAAAPGAARRGRNRR